MSTADTTSPKPERGLKTLAIRLEPDLHAQLSLIAQLRDRTITDEIREALTSHIQTIKAQPDFAARADDVLNAIEREAVARRHAISSLFDSQPNEQRDASAAGRPRSRKAGSGETP